MSVLGAKMKKKSFLKPEVFIIDVDGVLTTGQFIYSAKGKIMKVFGDGDNDGLSLLRHYIEIRFVTGDERGFPISKKRVVDDMKYPLDLVSTIKRLDWIKELYNPKKVIYMGDGLLDHYVFREVGYSIAPANADDAAIKYASFVTSRKSAQRAVCEACLHILGRFFEPYNPLKLPQTKIKLSGKWGT
jgi:3-deoxy-D-manno-octulosonate 8-phosphate phosphatase (KDO 8-P phosphatase)